MIKISGYEGFAKDKCFAGLETMMELQYESNEIEVVLTNLIKQPIE